MLIMDSLIITAILIIIMIVALLVLLENDRPFSASAGLIIFIGAYITLTKTNPLAFIAENIFLIMAAAVCYVVIGVAWSYFKFFWYVSDIAERYREWKEGIKKSNNTDKWTEMEWSNLAARNNFSRPTVGRSKEKIYGWMLFWPLSALWFVSHEPITRAYKFAYKLMNGAYHRLVSKYFDEFTELN